MKSLVKLLDASGLEMEIKFFDRDTLEPINYLAVNTVDIKVHHPAYKRNDFTFDRDLENLRSNMGVKISGLSEIKGGKTVKFSPAENTEVLA